ncbi:MAG: hypothetical protein HY903_21770 [Deltaproteobacteria bacterium]|nr:hypothetical protein [Deltaproteobacteria bacterium]
MEDIETDAHPTVQLCASENRRVYHVLEAFEGQGAFAVATFLTDRPGLDAIARAVGGHPGTLGTGGPAGSGLERRLTDLRDGIARRGFTPSGDASRADFEAPGAVRLPLQVTPDRCYTLAALADGDITDADLVLYDPEGQALVRDVRPERDAFAQLCPTTPSTLSVEVRARPGRGLVLVQTYTADAATLGGTNALWLGERLHGQSSTRSPSEAAQSAASALSALGFQPANPRESLHFAPGEVRERSVSVPVRGCTAVSVSSGPNLGRVRVELTTDDGAVVARGSTRDGTSVAVSCGPTAALRAVLVADSGTGPGVLQVFTATTAPGWSSGLEPELLSNVWASLWGVPSGRWREQPPSRLQPSTGGVRRVTLERPAGQCARWTLVAGRGSPWVTLEVRGAQGTAPDRATGEGVATLSRCGREAESVTLEARVEPSERELMLLGWTGPLPDL